MHLAAGMTVVHPAHGIAAVEEVSTRTLNGESVEWATLRCVDSDLTIGFPVENLELIGLREPLGRAAAEAILDDLSNEATGPSNWSRRFKANEEKLRSGKPDRLAEVVNDLVIRREAGKLSPEEVKVLQGALATLAGELAISLESTFDATCAAIEKRILNR